MQRKRHFLFLQGFTSHFLTALAVKLRHEGHKVSKVNFNMGDCLYWGIQSAYNFRKPNSELGNFYQNIFIKNQFTDVVVMGDQRRIHTEIYPIAKANGATVHVFEEGYLRPSWVTLERNGVNGNSQLPKDSEWYRETAKLLPDYQDGRPVSNPIRMLALHEIAYHLPNTLNPVFYKGYRTHRPAISGLEFTGWAKRFSRMPLWERQNNKSIKQLIQSNHEFYLLPLQLDCDSQIIHHSPFGSMTEVINKVVNSFAKLAPSNTILVIKNHPLDTGFINFQKVISALEKQNSLEGRILYLESGHLPTLLNSTRGVITINSTVGTSSLIHNCPTIALGTAIYDMEGLTFQGELEEFWDKAEEPDSKLYRNFRNTVIHTTQINGGFYTRHGVNMAVQNCCAQLSDEQSPLEQLLHVTNYSESRIKLAQKPSYQAQSLSEAV